MQPNPHSEPSFDPTDELDEAIDARRPASPKVDPLMLLAGLSIRGEISMTERDAGVMFHQMTHFIGANKTLATLSLSWRDAAGKWTIRRLSRQEVAAELKAARAAVQNENRLQALNLALAADEPAYDPHKASRLSLALGDLVRHWWGEAKAPTHVNAQGITLPLAAAANDNDPTAERQRLAANDNARTPDGAWQMKDWPLARMHSRGQIDPDVDMNDVLFAAGMRYAQDAHLAGMSGGVASPDYAKPIVDGGAGPDAFSERRVARLQSYARARWVLGKRYGPVVDAIVLDERTLTEAGSFVGVSHERAAREVAKERLNEGLRRLAVHYGQLQAAA